MAPPGSNRRHLRKTVFRPITAAKRALYRRRFRKFLSRHHQTSTTNRKQLERLFCRLMHRQYLAQELKARPRQHCLLLDKHVGTPAKTNSGGCGGGGTIPSYFRKRVLRHRLEEKRKEQEEEEEQEEVVVDDGCESDSSDEAVLLDEEDRDVVVEDKKHPEIPDPTKFSVLKDEIKEYCALQEKVQIVLSMLKSRAQELEKDDGEGEKGEEEEKKPEVKEEPADELKTLTEQYYDDDSDDDIVEVKQVKGEKNVGAAGDTPDIVFVDPDALDNDSQADDKPVVANCKEESLPEKSLKEISKEDLLDPTLSNVKLEPIDKTNSVVDALFSRFKLTLPVTPPKSSKPAEESEEQVKSRLRDRRKIPAPRYVEEDEEPKKIRPSKIFDKIHKKLNIELENPNSSSSTEFYGFDEGEAIKLDKPSVPGLLPTPILKRSRPNAPFLEHGTSFEDIKIENRDDLFREEGLISLGSLPPRLECPKRPDDMIRPRTVAQKRILLQKKNDVRYLMIDNESKIFYELEKRSKNIDAELDFDRMEELQDQNIPFTRDTWRALAWMRTVKGRYFFQTLKLDNHAIKLNGCKGNHPTKRMGKKQHSAPANLGRKHVCRCPEFPPGVTIDLSAIEPRAPSEEKSEPEEPSPPPVEKKLFSSKPNRLVTSRPGPLSSKFRYDNKLLHQTEDGAYLGPLEVLEMPGVEIEVFPKIDRPLDPTIKPYLKMILPFKGITEKWARFAVSTLKTPDLAEADIPQEDKSFSFSLPYQNNQSRILIRRRVIEAASTKQPVGSLEKFQRQLNEPLSFRKHLDEPADPDNVDPLEKECADVLSDMTNAVAIGLADEAFLQRDPDCDYTRTDKPVNKPAASAQDAAKASESTAKSKRMLREMRRLNATIIESLPEPEPAAASGDQSGSRKRRCDERYCARGCICDVFEVRRKPKGVAPHCNSIECVFGCGCGFDRKQQLRGAVNREVVQGAGAGALSSEDVKYLREKATAKLAKEEREFTPTVILTTNSTVLVRNTETEARRHKKKPKKYEDYYNDSSVKNLLNGNVPEEEEQRESSVERVGRGVGGKVVDKPVSLSEKIRHTRVVLNKLQDLDGIEPWCMIHCLYRCYCRGKATSGKPFKFNEESDIVLPTPMPAPEPDPLLQVYEPRRRRLYSFEKTEKEGDEVVESQPLLVEPLRKRDSSEESYKPWNERRKKRRRTLEDQQPSQPSTSTRASIEDLQIVDGQTCRRVIPVNRNFYKTRNYYRRERVIREDQEHKRKYPMVERRLKSLLERCEKRFFEDRRRELERQAKRAQAEKKSAEQPATASSTPEPIHIDISDGSETLKANPLLRPLLDANKVLIYCGVKKYYVEKDAITSGRINLSSIAKKFRTTVYVIRKVPENPQAKFISFKLNDVSITIRGRKYRKTAPQVPKEPEVTAPPAQDPAEKKVMLEQVNSDIAHTMRHIREMLRKNSAVLNQPKKGILYLFRWEKFLQAYNEDTLDVWDIVFQNGTSLVIITTEVTRKNVPSFKNTKLVRSVRKCNFETKGVSLITQMLIAQVDNPETSKLALVLFGTENYWRFCGFIKAEKNFLNQGCEARPTPLSHPKLAPKINQYYEAFAATNQKRQPPPEPPKPKQEDPPPQPEEPQPTPTSTSTSEPPKFKSNVKLMETKIKDFKNIAIPNVPGSRRWFMLTIVNDFSDIYIPSWKSCLTYGRIMQAIQLANRYRKTVKLTSIVLKNAQEDVLPQIYAAPGQGDCIFLGPYSYTQTIDLMLCQNVDGKMYTREEYERNNHIVRTEQTTGSWLYMKQGAEVKAAAATAMEGTSEGAETGQQTFLKLTPGTQVATVTTTAAAADDCVVIDDDEDDEEASKKLVVEEQPSGSPQDNSNLDSLIHQLYDDSDEDATTKEVTPAPEQPPKQLPKNDLSKLVEKTIAESKQLKIQPVPLEKLVGTKRKSTGSEAVPEVKAKRLSLPAATVAKAAVAADEVVCLDDDEDGTSTTSVKAKTPSSTTILNSQQAALIASKINLMNPTQKGVMYNPSTGVLRIKRSLMNSLTEGSAVALPAVASSSKSPPKPVAPSSSSETPKQSIVAPKVPTAGVLRSNIPGMGLVPVVWSSHDIILKVRELSVKLQYVRLSNFEAGIMLLNRFIRKNTYTFKPFTLTIGWKFEARTTPLAPEENLINTISLRCVVTPDGVIDLYKASAIVAFQTTKPNFYEELLLLRLSILCCKKEQYESEKCHKFFENIFLKAANTIKELTAASEALTTQSTFLREQQEQHKAKLAKLGGKSTTTAKTTTARPSLTMVSKRVAVPQSILEQVAKPATSAPDQDQPGKPKEAVIIIDDD
uniref:(northern house mosquito) hypothetical protein n=1 Tax=Culex pipiens TaxID=7175 RepID=A0A8D8FMQ0_CULPI